MATVTIIIPNYNGEKYLADCIDSCLDQGASVREVIIVDDNSTDKSLSLLDKYRLDHPGLIQFYTNPGKGACAARNFGYLKSTGEFIQFLDSDDVLAPGKIQSQLNALLTAVDYKNRLIHSKWGRFRDNKDVYFWGPHESISKDLKPVDWLIANHMSMTGCWLTHRSLIEKGGLWDESLKRNQDGEFFARIMLHATEVLFCKEAKVYYRSGMPGSISSTKTSAAAVSNLRAIQKIAQYIFSLEESSRTRLAVANMYQSFILEYYLAFPEIAETAEKKVGELGGATVEIQGGLALRMLCKVIGWKQTLKIKKLLINTYSNFVNRT